MNINLLGKGYVANKDTVVADWEINCKNPTEWDIVLEKKEDWYEWTESFSATHCTLGTVTGDSKGNIIVQPTQTEAFLVEAFNRDIECTLDDFDTWDI
jgi:hypothetical protein